MLATKPLPGVQLVGAQREESAKQNKGDRLDAWRKPLGKIPFMPGVGLKIIWCQSKNRPESTLLAHLFIRQ